MAFLNGVYVPNAAHPVAGVSVLLPLLRAPHGDVFRLITFPILSICPGLA